MQKSHAIIQKIMQGALDFQGLDSSNSYKFATDHS